MTFNKIPLALGFNSSTGNASGLVEFTLDLSNVGDVCEATPTPGQTLVYSSTGKWCPSTIATGGGGGGGGAVNSVNDLTGSVSLYFSSLSGTEIDSPSNNEVLVYQSDKWINQTVAEAGLATAANLTTTTNTANAAMPKGGGAFVGAVTTNSTFDGVDIATRDGVLTTTTTTANAALPKVGGVDKNSLVITTNASAVSSLSGASGSIVYFGGTTPLAPSLKTFAQILSNENYNIAAGTTYADDSTVVKTAGDQTVAGVKTFTSNPILQDTPANSVLFTNSTSSVSSTSGASGSIVCFEGTNPAPGLKTFVELLEDLVGSLQGGDILYVNAAGNLARLPKGSTGQVLTLDDGRMPSWSGGG